MLTRLEDAMEEKHGRWTASKKAEVVLQLLRGESIDAVSRECEVTVETLNKWREDFIAAGIAGLKGKTLEQVRIAALEKKIGQQAMELELHEKKDQFLRTRGGRSSR
jgi:transposase-like protein